MESYSLRFCIDCCHLRKDNASIEESYYCTRVLDDLPDGRVYPDTDASKCIRKGLYFLIKS